MQSSGRKIFCVPCWLKLVDWPTPNSSTFTSCLGEFLDGFSSRKINITIVGDINRHSYAFENYINYITATSGLIRIY